MRGPCSEDDVDLSSASSFVIHSTLLGFFPPSCPGLSFLRDLILYLHISLVAYTHLPLPTSSTAYPALSTLTDSPEHTTLPTFLLVPFHMVPHTAAYFRRPLPMEKKGRSGSESYFLHKSILLRHLDHTWSSHVNELRLGGREINCLDCRCINADVGVNCRA